MIRRIDIVGHEGTPMRAILVPAGEQPPNRPRMSPYDKDAVEFYDSRYPHTPDGQFICDYLVETFQEDSDNGRGLDLWGDVDSWKIDSLTRSLVSDWLAYHYKEKVIRNLTRG